MSKGRGSDRPAYRQALEAIGWYFDQHMYRGVFVAEIADGYIGKARPAEEDAETNAEGFTFPHSDVSALMAAAANGGPAPEHAPPFCPVGYGAFMRAVGEMYDRNEASLVSVLEVTNGFIIGFTVPARDGRKLERRRLILDQNAIGELINKAGI